MRCPECWRLRGFRRELKPDARERGTLRCEKCPAVVWTRDSGYLGSPAVEIAPPIVVRAAAVARPDPIWRELAGRTDDTAPRKSGRPPTHGLRFCVDSRFGPGCGASFRPECDRVRRCGPCRDTRWPEGSRQSRPAGRTTAVCEDTIAGPGCAENFRPTHGSQKRCYRCRGNRWPTGMETTRRNLAADRASSVQAVSA